MSLVGSIVFLLELALAATFAIFLFRYKSPTVDDLATTLEGTWYDTTLPLRKVHPVLPAVAFAGLWFGGFVLSAFAEAYIMGSILMFGLPGLLVIRAAFRIPELVAALGDIGDLFRTVTPDADNFAIPIRYFGGRADDVSRFSSAMRIPRRSLLAVGASGSGKSEFLKHIVDQLDSNPDEPVVIFDMKTDYQEMLEERGADVVRISADETAHKWNLFEEIERESDIDELARGIFPSGSDGDEFFTKAARQVFAATVKMLYRDPEFGYPTNADLKRYWETTDAETMKEDIEEHDDLVAAASALSGDRQAAGVYATAQQHVDDLFVGDFGREGGFSVREYMEDPRGRVLVLDYPSRQASTIAPVFALLIDRAIMHGMADSANGAYYLLDEIEHLDVTISRLGELINVGRGRGCQAIITLQSVAQLYDTYSKERGQAFLSGMTTAVILRVADEASVEYARSRIGTHFEEFTHRERPEVGLFGSKETKLEEQHDFAKGDFAQFDPGEAVICRQSSGWVHGYIPMLEQHSSADSDDGAGDLDREQRELEYDDSEQRIAADGSGGSGGDDR